MKIQQFVKLAVATLLIGTFSVQAHANSCGELSPLMGMLGDNYTQLVYSPEDAAGEIDLNHDGLIALIKKSKLHSGRGKRVDCLGTKGWGEEVASSFTLADIDLRETTKGSLILTAFTKILKENNREVIELPKAEYWRANSANSYSTSTLFRLGNHSNKGSRPAELALTLKGNDNGVTVTETLYINGRKFVWTTWELDS